MKRLDIDLIYQAAPVCPLSPLGHEELLGYEKKINGCHLHGFWISEKKHKPGFHLPILMCPLLADK